MHVCLFEFLLEKKKQIKTKEGDTCVGTTKIR